MYSAGDNPAVSSTGEPIEADRLRAAIGEKRGTLVEAERRLAAMAQQVAAMQRAINELQRVGLIGLLTGARGKNDERVRALRREMFESQMKYEKAARSISSLQCDVAELEKDLARVQRDRLKRGTVETGDELRALPPMPHAEDTGREVRMSQTERTALVERAKLLQRAVDGADEARRDVLSEIETVATLGRCGVVQVRGILGDLLESSRDDTADECAQRIRKAVERFLGRRSEAFAGAEMPVEADEFENLHILERAVREICGAWLRPQLDGETPAMAVAEALTHASMFLEKRLRQTRESMSG